jgi:hypothetical protein
MNQTPDNHQTQDNTETLLVCIESLEYFITQSHPAISLTEPIYFFNHNQPGKQTALRYFILTPTRYAQLRTRIANVRSAYLSAHPNAPTHSQWITIKTAFNQIHEWAINHYGESVLLNALNQYQANPVPIPAPNPPSQYEQLQTAFCPAIRSCPQLYGRSHR